MATNPNDTAFSIPATWRPSDGAQEHREEYGLTKREYIAAMVLSGVITAFEVQNECMAAKYAVEYADALIAELNKPATGSEVQS